MAATMTDLAGQLSTLGFVKADGAVNPSGPTMKDISQPGVAGAAFLRDGYKGMPFRITTMAAFSSAGAVATAQILYAQYRTRNVTFADHNGNSWANLFVLNVTITNTQRITSGVGLLSGMSYMVFAEWELPEHHLA